jgi:hypothetical protein
MMILTLKRTNLNDLRCDRFSVEKVDQCDRDRNRENCDRLNRQLLTRCSQQIGIIVSLLQKSFLELSIFLGCTKI